MKNFDNSMDPLHKSEHFSKFMIELYRKRAKASFVARNKITLVD